MIHNTADVDPKATIGDGTSVWQNVQIRAGAQVGEECIIGKGAFLDLWVKVGNRVKIQNYANIFRGVTLEDGVMVGPNVIFTNDMFPRAVNPDGQLQDHEDWECFETLVKEGVGIGAGSVIVCNNTIGKWAIIGAGSVVTQNIPDYALAYGNPARVHGFVCPCGTKLPERQDLAGEEQVTCPKCKTTIILPACPELIRKDR